MFLKDNKAADSSSSTPAPASADSAPKQAGSGVPSIISQDLKIVGDLKSNGDVQVDGTVEGDIDSRLLIVGAGARIEGSIRSETVRVCGAVHGQIKAKSVTLDKTAKVVGDVIHESLTMESGAFLEGGVRRIEKSDPVASVSPLRPSGAGAGGAGNGQDGKNGYGDSARGSVL